MKLQVEFQWGLYFFFKNKLNKNSTNYLNTKEQTTKGSQKMNSGNRVV
jgi:hypothetical protein